MSYELRDLSMQQNQAINAAAALANEQLGYATNIVHEAGHGSDPILIAAVLQAIATNFATAAQ